MPMLLTILPAFLTMKADVTEAEHLDESITRPDGAITAASTAVNERLVAAERLVQEDAAEAARGAPIRDRIQRILATTLAVFAVRRATLYGAGPTAIAQAEATSPGSDDARHGTSHSIPLGLCPGARLELEFMANQRALDATDRATLGLVAQRLALLSNLLRESEILGAAQRFEAIGRLASGVAHDFNNALTAILGYVQLVGIDVPPESASHRLAERALQSVRFAAAMTRQLLDFSRGGSTPELVSFHQVITNIDHLLRSLLGDRRQLVLSIHPEATLVRAVPVALEQVLLNLVANARDAIAEDGTVEISTSAAESDGRRFAVLSVRDDGHGIPEHVLPHLFEPLFSTKCADQGTGLGLATVQNIVQALGGTVAVESAPGSGSRFTIRIPAAPL